MPYTLKQRLLLRAAPRLGALATRALACTWSIRETGETRLSVTSPQPEPRIYAYWHEFVLTAVGIYRDRAIHPFASRSFDGEIVSRTMDHLGFGETARGSSSRGGAQGLLELKRFLAEGGHVAVTVDGPKGPRRVAQEGVIKLAQLSGRAIVPFFFSSPRAYRLRSWDRMLLPRPFMSGEVRFGREIRVEREARDLAGPLRQMQAELDRLGGEDEPGS